AMQESVCSRSLRSDSGRPLGMWLDRKRCPNHGSVRKQVGSMDSGLNRRGFLSVTGQSATAALAAKVIDVRDYKAVGDGKTDDTAAIQKALDAAAKSNGTVHIPEGVFR